MRPAPQACSRVADTAGPLHYLFRPTKQALAQGREGKGSALGSHSVSVLVTKVLEPPNESSTFSLHQTCGLLNQPGLQPGTVGVALTPVSESWFFSTVPEPLPTAPTEVGSLAKRPHCAVGHTQALMLQYWHEATSASAGSPGP